jgi:hypothetical protein
MTNGQYAYRAEPAKYGTLRQTLLWGLSHLENKPLSKICENSFILWVSNFLMFSSKCFMNFEIATSHTVHFYKLYYFVRSQTELSLTKF